RKDEQLQTALKPALPRIAEQRRAKRLFAYSSTDAGLLVGFPLCCPVERFAVFGPALGKYPAARLAACDQENFNILALPSPGQGSRLNRRRNSSQQPPQALDQIFHPDADHQQAT